MIFDRWGALLYQRENFALENAGRVESWDGTFNGRLLNPGIYVYYLKVEWEGGEVETYEGDVFLSR